MSDKVVYSSDPDWGNGTGQVWRIDRDGKTTLVADKITANAPNSTRIISACLIGSSVQA